MQQSLQDQLAFYQNPLTFVCIFIALSILFGTVTPFQINPQLLLAPKRLLQTPTMLPVSLFWQTPLSFHMSLSSYFLIWWVLLFMSFRLMVPQNPSQTMGMRVMMMKTVSSQITALQLDNTPPWIYQIPKV